MEPQNFEKRNEKIRNAFVELKTSRPERLTQPLCLSWSNWGFGREPLATSAKRLRDNDVEYIELHGNHYGDVYHMYTEESHVGRALLDAGERLTNLHMADSNRGALGDGSMDLDTIIMALYLIGFNREGCFVTPEPLGPGGDPYPAMHGKPDPVVLDELVRRTVRCFRAREEILKG